MFFSITAGAFCRARRKLLHTAYVELNDDIIHIYYKNNDIKRYKGYRLLAFDGSKIILPNTKDIKKEFGSVPIVNQTEQKLGDYALAAYEACYDVLNNIAVQSSLTRAPIYECDLAEKMIQQLKVDDIAIFDRGYAAYSFMASLIKNNKQFIIRCPKSSFVSVNRMFEADAPESRTVIIEAPSTQKKQVVESGLPTTIKIRLVRVILSTGEVEVLATTLLEENEIGTEEFKYLYGLRWGVETFFSKIKNRLGLENFTGKTAESVKQDFWSTIFISNLETIMTEKTEEKMNSEKMGKAKKIKVNKAVSFNAIKKMAFDIFFLKKDKSLVMEKLDNLFRMNPVLIRENRNSQHKTASPVRSLHFQKRVRKHVY